MNEIFCIDETFDIHSTLSSYHLSIQAGFDAFSFTVLNTVSNKYILLKSIPLPDVSEEILFEHIEKKIKEDEYLSAPYKSVFVTFKTPKFTFVPEKYLIQNNIKPLIDKCFQIEDLDEIHVQNISAYKNAACVYILPNQFTNTILKYHKNSRFLFHLLPSFIDGIEISKNHTQDNYFFLNINTNRFEILFFKGGNLMLHNSFFYLSAQDILYYTLYAAKCLNLSTNEITMILSGNVEKNSSLYSVLSKYFLTIKFSALKKGFVYSYTFNKFSAHQFSNLINLFACES